MTIWRFRDPEADPNSLQDLETTTMEPRFRAPGLDDHLDSPVLTVTDKEDARHEELATATFGRHRALDRCPAGDRLSGRRGFPCPPMRRPDGGDIAIENLGVAEQALGYDRRLRFPGVPIGLVPLSRWPCPGGAV